MPHGDPGRSGAEEVGRGSPPPGKLYDGYECRQIGVAARASPEPFDRMTFRRPGLLSLPLMVVSALSCGDSSGPEIPFALAFSDARLDLGLGREGTAEVRNTGSRALGPIQIAAGPVRDAGGSTAPGSRVVVDPAEIPTLEPGAAASVRVTLEVPGTLQPGPYDAALEATVGTQARAVLDVRFEVPDNPPATGPARVTITNATAAVRQGDVVTFQAEVSDAVGTSLAVPVTWSVLPPSAGRFGTNGQFVGYTPGEARVVARVDSIADTIVVGIDARGLRGSFSVLARGILSARFTSDLWVHGGYAYTGTWGSRTTAAGTLNGDRLYVWDISQITDPRIVDSLAAEARTVNDVKVRADGSLGMFTHERDLAGKNGVTFLDLTDPAHPRVFSRFTDGLEAGVHNGWLEGSYAYVAVDGPSGGLRVIDVSDPRRPRAVASFHAGESFIHDVYVRNGLAFVSHWNAGLVILDVGNGMAGGSPANPVEVSRIQTEGGQTHNAWYWPAGGYAFVGEEDGRVGVMHVVDVRNLSAPREVATFAVEGDTPHNFWVDEDRKVLYAAWYSQGVRAIDVGGELLGELDRQGREIAASVYGDPAVAGCGGPVEATCTWAPQLYQGLVYASDLNGGLVVLQPPS